MSVIVPFVHGLNASEEAKWIEALQAAATDITVQPLRDLTPDQAQVVQVAIVANPDPAELATLPQLKWVHSLWAGVEKLMPALAQTNINVARLTDTRLTQAMSEAVLAWALYLHRDMPRYRAQQDQKQWQQWPVMIPEDRTIAVLGLGELGAAAAIRLRDNDFKVLGWSRTHKAIEGIETFSGEDGLTTVLRRADIVVVLLPLTPQTQGLLDRHKLAAMKKGASLINFARAAILDEEALLNGLASRHLDHAVLDVFSQEPLPQTSPLWMNPNITILPHISAPTNKSSASVQVVGTIEAWLESGQAPQFVERLRGY
jgi:glyoxylate/hydroxypyruvate reductase